MPYFVRLVKYTQEGAEDIDKFKTYRQDFLEEAEKQGITVHGEYATLGPVDLVSVIEAPDLQTALKLSASQASKGRTSVQTLPAVSVEDFEGITESL